jgi:Nickel responsive protein SCO4226-like
VKGLQVATFLVLRQLPGVTRDQYAAAQQAAMDAASQSTADGRVVRYLGGFFLPGAGRAICIFGADSAADVTIVNQHAGVPFTEVLEAIEMQPQARYG